MAAQRGQLPKAYLRIDPNLDATHPAPGDMVTLLCAANRQPTRGRFKTAAVARSALGSRLFKVSVSRGDIVAVDSIYYVCGWHDWQEGDMTVGERMRHMRSKRDEKNGHGNA